ncbi:MAG: helix-turn-helix domain-containing protein [Clostridia bacterium]|nr:helix-turn-helix domain-containing protein [Clostridia bacterium]
MAKIKEKLTSIQNRINRDYIQYNAYITRDASHEALAVYQSGVKSANRAGYLSGPAIYDHYIIHYITHGRGQYYVGNKTIPLEKGDAFLIKPYERICYQADVDDPYLYYWVGFNGTEAENLLLKSGFDSHHLTIHYDKDDRVKSIMKQISETKLLLPSQEYSLIGLLYQFFALLIENNSAYDHTHIDENHLYAAICYIRTQIANPSLSVQQIADTIGVHRSHLYRVFQSTTNQSVQEYILSLRFDKAKQLLLHTSYPIIDISATCGFTDPSHFSVLFKKKVGMSPRKYRMQYTNT